MLDGKIGLWANIGLVNIPVSAQHHKVWTLQPPGEGTGTRKLAPTLATQQRFRNWRSDSCGVHSWFRIHCNTAKWQSSFLFQGSITPTDFSLQKCFLPFESRVFTIYCAAGALLVILVLAHVQLLTPPFYFAQRLISKHKAVWRARHLHSVTEIPKLRTVKHQTIFMPANDLIWLLVWRQVAFTHTIEVLYSWYDYYRINN